MSNFSCTFELIITYYIGRFSFSIFGNFPLSVFIVPADSQFFPPTKVDTVGF